MKTKTFNEIIRKAIKELKENPEKNILILLCGNSGSGKTTFEFKLTKKNSNKFFKLPQCTTREKRPYEKPYTYYYITKDTYDSIKSKLIARIQGNSFNGTCYGTIPVFSKGKINTCIASYEAIDDINEMVTNGSKVLANTSIYVLLFDIRYENLVAKREGRDKEFIEKETKELVNSIEIACESGAITGGVGYWKFEDNNFKFPEMSDVGLRDD
jgi:guanylate kinase